MIKSLFIMLIFCKVIISQTPLIIDLSKINSKEELQIDGNKNYAVTVINKLPNKEYTINIQTKRYEIPPFNAADVKIGQYSDSGKGLSPECRDNKTDIIKKLEEISTLKNETDVPKKIEVLKEILKTIETNGCENVEAEMDSFIVNSREVINKVNYFVQNLETKIGYQYIVTIRRMSEGTNDTDKEWEVTYKTEERGTWQVSYGLTFISNWFGQDREYIAKKKDDTSVVALFERSKSLGDIAPAVFFSWLPTSMKDKDWSIAPTLGLGFDFSSPVAYGGLCITYNWNINFLAGITIRPVKRPNEGFSVDQKIEASDVENLNRNVGTIYPFVGFSYRFGTNPFKKEATETSE